MPPNYWIVAIGILTLLLLEGVLWLKSYRLDDDEEPPKVCPLCGTPGKLTLHHTLFPRWKWCNHPLREKLTIYLCLDCHMIVHKSYLECRFRPAERRMRGEEE